MRWSSRRDVVPMVLIGLAACSSVVTGPMDAGSPVDAGAGDTAYSAADTLPACADAGGTCAPFVAQCGSKGAGPAGSCAYPDETCCLQ